MQIHTHNFSAALIAKSSMARIAIHQVIGCNGKMKTIEEIRRERLEKLIEELNDPRTGTGGAAIISERCGFSGSQISQWKNASADHKSGRVRARPVRAFLRHAKFYKQF